MFGFSFGEMLLIGLVTLVVVGPQRLPAMLKTMGGWARKLRKMTMDVRQQTGIDEMLRAEGIQLSELRSLMRGYHGGAPAPAATGTAARAYEDPYANIDPDPLREYPPEGADAYGALPDDLLESAAPTPAITAPAPAITAPAIAEPAAAPALTAPPAPAPAVAEPAAPEPPPAVTAPEPAPAEPAPAPVPLAAPVAAAAPSPAAVPPRPASAPRPAAAPPSAPVRSVPPPAPVRSARPPGTPPPPPRRTVPPATAAPKPEIGSAPAVAPTGQGTNGNG